MKFEAFIVRKLLANSEFNFAKPVINLSIASISLGLSVMIIASFIVSGFQKNISDKLTGFGSHIQISGYESNKSFESVPIENSPELKDNILKTGLVSHIQSYAYKAGIIKTKNQIEGIVFKGISGDFNWGFLSKSLTEGNLPFINDSSRSNQILISSFIAKRLQLQTGDPLYVYFLNNEDMQARGRKFEITGIYNTDLAEFDKIFIVGDLKHIQKLNKWNQNTIGGYEIFLNDFSTLEESTSIIKNIAGYQLKTQNIRQIYPQLFEWLKLHDINVVIIIGLMIILSGITIISTLLILILERSQFIGILKSLGALNSNIRRIFIYFVSIITAKGLLIGNLIGIGICLLQHFTGFFKLDPESYYVDTVPIHFSFEILMAINFGTFIISIIMVIIPSLVISRISPVKVLRFQ